MHFWPALVILSLLTPALATGAELCDFNLIPLSQRAAYIRQNPEKLFAMNNHEIDSIVGLRVDELDRELAQTLTINGRFSNEKARQRFGNEEIWYSPGAGQQTWWHDLFEVAEQMRLRHGDLVADLGSGIGRLGLLVGIFHPEVNFVGIELVPERVAYANQAAQELGLKNVKFIAGNLAEVDLPKADHFYMFNPTNAATSDLIVTKLVSLSERKKFKVHLLTWIQSESFRKEFEAVPGGKGRSKTFVRRGNGLKLWAKRTFSLK